MGSLGVGFIGAGIATQAIHLPTVAALGGRLRVRHVMDVDAGVAADVAASVGARWTTQAAEVLDDPDVDIVVVASPAEAHAEQVVAACVAGKRAILCEKPLATRREDTRLILEAARSSGAPVLVGTMHAYDPACRAAIAAWRSATGSAAGRGGGLAAGSDPGSGGAPAGSAGSAGPSAGPPVLVRSRINLPDDGMFICAATQPRSVPPPWTVPARPWGAGAQATFLTDMMLGLVIHDIPLVREFLPAVDRVTSAATPAPIGYAMTARCGTGCAEFLGLVAADWEADWRLEAWSPAARLSIDFGPSYVHAGSAVARLETADGTRGWRYPHNGYLGEWNQLVDLAAELAAPLIPLETAVADLEFALDIAEGAAALLEGTRR